MYIGTISKLYSTGEEKMKTEIESEDYLLGLAGQPLPHISY